MNILLVINKTLQSGTKKWVDGSYENFYIPLQNLGHNVYFYDTVDPDEIDLDKVVDSFKPDLIFCCMTGDPRLTPFEPWESIQKQTEKGNCKTFNWFCDDTWRFNSFSSVVCKYFHVCSTPEIGYIDRFKEIGYDNIILGFWLANIDVFPKNVKKTRNITFCGQPNHDRKFYIDLLKNNNIDVENFHGLDRKEMLLKLSESRIGINFSKNFNGHTPKLQMKGRMVEVTAARSLLLTEYAPGLEEHYEIDKEIITFKTGDEMLKKAAFLLKSPKVVERISENGFTRFMKDHESKIKLSRMIDKIMRL